MGKVPVDLRKNIANNIRNCRSGRFPKWGGSKKCAEAFGVSPQQWSQWESGKHMPDEYRMMQIADFFGVSTEFLRRDNTRPGKETVEPRKPHGGFRVVRIDDGGRSAAPGGGGAGNLPKQLRGAHRAHPLRETTVFPGVETQ